MSPSRSVALRVRAIDLGLTLLLAPIWGPLLLLGMAAALVSQGRPIFYRAGRLGKDGTTFRMLKLRTMVRHADRQGPAVASSADVRITPVGRILRRTKLDELPQFLHVLKGEMSIVGPRPEAPSYLKHYTEAGLCALAAKPGLTGYGALYFFSVERSVQGGDFEDRYLREILPTRLLLDERCWTELQARPLRTTLRVVFLTVRLVLLKGSVPTSPSQLAARFLG